MDILFPEYFIESTAPSDVIKGKMIGVVRGYQNTPEFDAMMDSEQFSTIDAVNELQLMKLLVAKRVDLIIGDPEVFNFSVSFSNLANQNKQALLNGVEAVQPALKYNHLYFAVSKKYTELHTLLDDINLALLEFQQSGETDRIVNTDSKCQLNL